MDEEPQPLLRTTGLPAFDRIRPEHVEPGMARVLERSEQILDQVERDAEPTWERLMEPFDAMEPLFEYSWGALCHLLNVKNSEALREAHARVQPAVVEFSLRCRQSEKVYRGLQELRGSARWKELDAGQQRAVELRLRDAENAGVGLTGEQRKRFNEIEQELSQLSTRFANHVLDATKAFALVITDPADTEGWPDSLRQVTAEAHARTQRDGAPADPAAGPWRVTLDYPSYAPFLRHSRRPEQREQVFKAYTTRASSGPLDNTPLILRLLELRREKARLLGHESYAAWNLASNMAGSVDRVMAMYDPLITHARPHAARELEEIRRVARESGFEGPLELWDLAFFEERWREQLFDFSDDDLRPYFPLSRVLSGLFGLVERLFGARFRPVPEDVPVWHPDVQCYELMDADGQRLALMYLDPHSRPDEKRSGAWMVQCRGRRVTNGERVVPVVHICANGTPPAGGRESLLGFREVTTLFHECGHALQAMLTTIDTVEVSGLAGIEHDAIELPSQFMENWCYDRATLLGMAAHVDTGAPLPEHLFEKILQARTFRAGGLMIRQLEFGLTDLELHGDYDPRGSLSPFELYFRVVDRLNVIPAWEADRFLCSFQHIFAGGYGAGYYGYKWAEVLSADAFSAFEEVGLEHEEEVVRLGRKFRSTVLALGGSRHPMEVFREFRGREPSAEALLRQNALL